MNGFRAFKSVLAVSRERHLSVTAAGLAYHMFSSAIPLFLLIFVGVSLTSSPDVLVPGLETVAGSGATRFLRQNIGNGAGRWRAAVIAAVLLLWNAVRMFESLHGIFAELYDARKEASMRDRLSDVALGLAVVAAAFALLAVVGVALPFVVKRAAWSYLGPVVLFVALVLVFFPLYYVFPLDTTVRESLPGTVFTAAAWTLSGVGFRVYATTSQSVQLYGVVGALLLVLAWFYVAALVLLVGVVLNAVLAGQVSPDYEWLPTRFVSKPRSEG